MEGGEGITGNMQCLHSCTRFDWWTFRLFQAMRGLHLICADMCPVLPFRAVPCRALSCPVLGLCVLGLCVVAAVAAVAVQV